MNENLNPGRPATAKPANGGDSADTENFAAPPRGPVDAIRTCLVKFFDFRGRASRSEFWWFFLGVSPFLIDRSVWIFPLAWVGVLSLPIETLSLIFIMAFFMTSLMRLPLWAVAVRRLHDINFRGWWILPDVIVTALSVIAMIYVLYTKGIDYVGLDDPIVSWMLANRAALPLSFWQAASMLSALYYGALFALACLCFLKGKPQNNRFDRGNALFEFSFNRRPA